MPYCLLVLLRLGKKRGTYGFLICFRGPSSGFGLLQENPRTAAPGLLAHADNDLPSNVSRFKIVHCLGGFAQRVGLVDDGGEQSTDDRGAVRLMQDDDFPAEAYERLHPAETPRFALTFVGRVCVLGALVFMIQCLAERAAREVWGTRHQVEVHSPWFAT